MAQLALNDIIASFDLFWLSSSPRGSILVFLFVVVVRLLFQCCLLWSIFFLYFTIDL